MSLTYAIPDNVKTIPDVRDALQKLIGKVINGEQGDGSIEGRLLTLESAGASTAPSNAQYVTLALNGTLSAERVLAVGAGASLVLADGGANANVTLTRGALTGDITASADSNATTLASVIVAGGPIGSATVTPIITYDAKGRLTAVSSATITPAASSITGGAALTRVDDTNVTLTLGGSPTAALLAATSLTLGWTGTLAVARGGSGAGTLTGLLQGNGTSAFTAITNSSTTGQVLRVTGASTYAWGALDLANSSAITGLLPFANIANGSALSVFGRASNSSGVMASITGTANQVLVVNSGGTALAFGQVNLASSSAVTGQLVATSFPALTGDVTTAGGALATTLATKYKTVSRILYIENPAATDVIPMCYVGDAVTVIAVRSVTDAGTVTFNIEQRGKFTPATTGTNVLASSQVADTNGEEVTGGFNDATVPADNWLVFVASAVASSPTKVWVNIEFTID